MPNQTASGALVLCESRIPLRYGEVSGSYACRITFDLRRPSAVNIENLEPMPFSRVDDGESPMLVEVPFCRDPIECIPIRTRHQIGGEMGGLYVTLIPRHSSILVDQGDSLSRVNAGIVNLGHYWSQPRAARSYLRLENEDWHFEFTPVTDETFLYPAQIQDESYFFTHHVVIERRDGKKFRPSESIEQLNLLSTFLSFCHEHWVSPALVSGVNEAGVVTMEEWGTRMLSPWQRGQNWLDEQHGYVIKELFPGYCIRMADSGWREAVKTAVYWYVRADTGHVGPDGAIVLLQAALERLAWHILVRHRRTLSAGGFGKLPAADQLRLLLNASSIPLGIPPDLRGINDAAAALSWKDGPDTFVGIRNRLIHPPKLEITKVKLPYYEAYQLGKWYLELVLLRAFEYKGVYSNRTKHRRWIGQVDPLPWSEAEQGNV